jgi:hypothetical protein
MSDMLLVCCTMELLLCESIPCESGCPVLTDLWSYVLIGVNEHNMKKCQMAAKVVSGKIRVGLGDQKTNTFRRCQVYLYGP